MLIQCDCNLVCIMCRHFYVVVVIAVRIAANVQ